MLDLDCERLYEEATADRLFPAHLSDWILRLSLVERSAATAGQASAISKRDYLCRRLWQRNCDGNSEAAERCWLHPVRLQHDDHDDDRIHEHCYAGMYDHFHRTAVNRRSFISGLIRVGAFIAFDPHRVIFDMAKGLYLPQPGTWGTLDRSQYPAILRRNAGSTILTRETLQKVLKLRQHFYDQDYLFWDEDRGIWLPTATGSA